MDSSFKKWINGKYLDKNKIDQLKKNFKKAKPYSYLELKDFFVEDRAIDILRELIKLRFYEKDADLFHFYQTNNIAAIKNKKLAEFRNFLASKEFLSFMNKLTGLEFKLGQVDLHGSMYSNTDHLLCHDDQLEGRSIAFLLYLTNMGPKDGGSLNLLDKKQKKAKKLIPKFNSFTFFHVSPISFHEVEEVVVEKQRIAIGGWFHDK